MSKSTGACKDSGHNSYQESPRCNLRGQMPRKAWPGVSLDRQVLVVKMYNIKKFALCSVGKWVP